MNQIAKIEEGREVSPQQRFRDELARMGDQFVAALPDHIKPERFQRIILTSVLGDPKLLRADRKSLLEAAMRAAQDGLMPDKREGAFVIFNTKVKIDGKDVWIDAVQWMPMIGGIIKKMHQSGEIAMVTAKVVYGDDIFRAWVDDQGEHVAYEQAEHPDYDTIRQVFAMARTKEGAVYVETLTPRDIEKIRSVSRSKDSGPWAKWWEEMAKKSAIRRLAKRLPLSADLHDLIQRDNDLYDLSRAPNPQPSLRDRLANARQQAAIEHEEGFDAGFVARETEGLPAGQDFSDEPDSPDEPSPLSSDEGSGDATPIPASTEPASAADQAGADDAGEVSAESVPVDADREFLLRVYRVMQDCVGPSVEDYNVGFRVFEDDLAAASDTVRRKAENIRSSLEFCCGENPKRTKLQARSYLAGVIGVDEGQLA